MWLLIIIVVVLLLRAAATSNAAANVPMVHKTICSSPTAGDSFTQGNTIAAGVPEPNASSYPAPSRYPVVHCNHIMAGKGTFYCGLPAHIIYPVAPPPISITAPPQSPARTYTPKAPIISRPIYNSGAAQQKLGPMYTCCFSAVSCTFIACGGPGGISGSKPTL